jgi:type II secretory ATPase GspE/PulE/Tfp pilus assembly ATPase PilB-like protein
VRKLCESCKKPVDYPVEVMQQFSKNGLQDVPHFASAGCAACRQTGYDGRRGIFEVMKVTDNIQDLVATNPSSADLRKLALKEGMDSLLSDGMDRVNRGMTTLEEALRAGGKS